MSMVSEIRGGLDNVADGLLTLAGAVCQLAAASKARDYGDQRNMGAVFFADASSLFAELTDRVTKEQAEAINKWVDGLIHPRAKK